MDVFLIFFIHVCVVEDTISVITVFNNPLSTNSAKLSNSLKQFVGSRQRIVWVYLINLWDWRLKVNSCVILTATFVCNPVSCMFTVFLRNMHLRLYYYMEFPYGQFFNQYTSCSVILLGASQAPRRSFRKSADFNATKFWKINFSMNFLKFLENPKCSTVPLF